MNEQPQPEGGGVAGGRGPGDASPSPASAGGGSEGAPASGGVTSSVGGTGTTGEPSGVTVPGKSKMSGSVPLTKVASCNFPRGANAVSTAGLICGGSFPFGGPPQIPRWGSLHVIAPAHGWRIA